MSSSKQRSGRNFPTFIPRKPAVMPLAVITEPEVGTSSPSLKMRGRIIEVTFFSISITRPPYFWMRLVNPLQDMNGTQISGKSCANDVSFSLITRYMSFNMFCAYLALDETMTQNFRSPYAIRYNIIASEIVVFPLPLGNSML